MRAYRVRKWISENILKIQNPAFIKPEKELAQYAKLPVTTIRTSFCADRCEGMDGNRKADFIKRQLCLSLADFLYSNFDRLPINISKIEQSELDEDGYKMPEVYNLNIRLVGEKE